jgi:UDP-3-O-[3-hydroxymyristoyl] glucosamine N-acyltransferase
MDTTAVDIARMVGGEIIGNPHQPICGAAPFFSATSSQITFAVKSKYLKKMDVSQAGVILVPKVFPETGKTVICVDHPQVAFAKVLNLFHPPTTPSAGIDSLASIHSSCSYGRKVYIAPFVVIGKNVIIGDRAALYPHVVIGDDVIIGDDVTIFPNVTVRERCIIGNRVIINAGTVIGSDGFGFASDGNKYYKIPHTGVVQIDDDVEIGACNTIDKATFGKTWIKQGVKTDNLIHIAHNVVVGQNTVFAAQVGISGSTTIGRNAILAGQAGVSEHLSIGDGAIVGPQAGVAQSVSDGQVVSGSPEMPHRLWLKIQRIIPRLPELRKKLAEIDKRLSLLESDNDE